MFNKFYNHPIVHIAMHKIILQVQLSYGLSLYIALIPQSKALYVCRFMKQKLNTNYFAMCCLGVVEIINH